MNIGEAIAIFKQLDSDKYTDKEKSVAIDTVVSMETHNSITKTELLNALRYLMDKAIFLCDMK